MEKRQRKSVWVLGAGFSRSLGGPLLSDLFSDHLKEELMIWLNSRQLQPPPYVEEMIEFYWNGRDKEAIRTYYNPRKNAASSATIPPFRRWGNAEQFLDCLDNAVLRQDELHDGVYPTYAYLSSRLEKLTASLTLKDIRDTALRWTAIECSAFLSDVDPNTELWEPYCQWAQQIQQENVYHVVLTFNYDRVLETIPLSYFHVRKPNEDEMLGRTPVYKLHGSVSWQRTANGVVLNATDELFALSASSSEIAIATPGPTKKTMIVGLNRLWEDALDHLRTADYIYFIGYRFPPSDSEARRRLLGAIRENRSPLRRIEIVLGPERTSDVLRLEGLLLHTVKNPNRVRVHHLYAEDFLTTYCK